MTINLLQAIYMLPITIFGKIKWIYLSCLFGSFGDGSYVSGKIYTSKPRNIFVGKSCQIGPFCRIETFPNYGNKESKPKLIIGDNCSLQHAVHIYCAESVELQKGCLIASGCMITDENHGNDPVGLDYVAQPLTIKPTLLKEGVWLGENVCVLPGSIIGKKCIIGANSVVNSNIPDYSIAVGNPAKVIKKYNFENKCWERV